MKKTYQFNLLTKLWCVFSIFLLNYCMSDENSPFVFFMKLSVTEKVVDFLPFSCPNLIWRVASDTHSLLHQETIDSSILFQFIYSTWLWVSSLHFFLSRLRFFFFDPFFFNIGSISPLFTQFLVGICVYCFCVLSFLVIGWRSRVNS